MLAVAAEAEITPLLTDGLGLAAVNGPELCVVSGPHEIVAALEKKLLDQGSSARSSKPLTLFIPR